MHRLIPLILLLALGGCSSIDIQDARVMTDAEIKRKLTEAPGMNARAPCLVNFAQDNQKPGLMCELVRQDRRALVEDIVKTDPTLLTCMPLLACAPTVEAYQHWKSRGAGLELSGTSPHASEKVLLPLQSLVVAAGTANPPIVAQHLLDEADPRQRTWYAGSALGQALNTWYASLVGPERQGFTPGLHPPGKELHFSGSEAVSRRNATPSAEIVRMLIEAGANLEDPSAAGAMSDFGVGHPGWRTPGQTYLDVFSRHIPGLAALGRQALDVRMKLHDCRQNLHRDACVTVVERAGPHSPSRVWAREQIARIDGEAAAWARLAAAQRCRVKRQDWLFEGDACEGEWAQGRGRARSRDGSTQVEGLFEQGLPSSGRLSVGGSPRYEGPFQGWTPEGAGVCWHRGQPEECRMLGGQRIDALHKQRQENERLQQALKAQEESARQARREAERDALREQRRQQDEDRKERRQAQAVAAGIAAMSGNYAPAAAAGLPGADTLRMAQQSNQTTAQFMQNQRTAAENARREAPRTASSPASRPGSAGPVAPTAPAAASAASTPDATEAARLAAARAQADRDAARDAAREAARKKADDERQAKEQARAQRQADFLADVKASLRLRAMTCNGRPVVTGSRGRVKVPFDVADCVDVAVKAYCPGDRSGIPALADNFVGIAGCLGDVYPLQGTPACEAEKMVVEVVEVRACR